MAAVNPYLHFNGNAEEAFNFYRSVFGGEFQTAARYKDAPPQPKTTDGDAEKMMHISLPIGQETILMGSDVPEAYGKVITGTNFYISINTESEEEAAKIFHGLSAGGQTMMPLEKTFWGAYFGMFKDKFGVQWMVNYDYNQRK